MSGILSNASEKFCESDAGALSIVEAIKVNKMLTFLDWSNNGISDAGATSIAEAIKVDKTLTNLNLTSNAIIRQSKSARL